MTFIQGVSGALIHNGKVLVVRRHKDDDFLAGYYELPGGKIDPGETHHQALEREFLEEVSLRVKAIKHYRDFTYQPGPNTSCVDYEYTVELAPGEKIENLKLSFEHDDYKWVDLPELEKLVPITDEKVTSIQLALAG